MNTHKNARLTFVRRIELVRDIVEKGLTPCNAAAVHGVSGPSARKWLGRYLAEGETGLSDRSSKPKRSPKRIKPEKALEIVELRRRRLTQARIAASLELSKSTVGRVLKRAGLSRLSDLEPSEPVVRYEHERPGDLIHLDTKKLGRIVAGPGHRATGDRRDHRRGVGWEVLHVAIDDATRLVYAELLPDERRYTTARFTVRALRWFASQGVAVERILTDNGSAYRSRPFARLLRRLGIAHKRTRPYRPQTNGKVERWIRTVLRECLYLAVFASSEQRRRALGRFIAFYNDRRPHLAFKGGPPPRQRLAQLMAAA